VHINGRLVGWVFCISTLFLLFRPPATWNEVFFLSSLNQRPLTIAVEGPESHFLLPSDGLVLHKSPYLPEWFLSFFTSFAHRLQKFAPQLSESLIGGSELLATRVSALMLAFIAGLLIFLAHRKSSREHGSKFKLNNTDDSNSASQNKVFAVHILILSLPVFVRWGAIEQILIMCTLSALTLLPPVTSKLRTDHTKTFWMLALCALALAVACSRTWTYSLAAASLLWLCFHKHRLLHFKRFVGTSLATSMLFSLLFLSTASYESFISHLTQRWLYLSDPRYLGGQWIGDNLLWMCAAGFIAILSLRQIVFILLQPNEHRIHLFAYLLALCGGIHLSLVQTMPIVADVLMLVLIFAATPNSNVPTQVASGFFKRISLGFIRALPLIYVLALLIALVIGSLLILSPASRLVPALKATVEGTRIVATNHPVLLTFSLLLAIAALMLVRVTRAGAFPLFKHVAQPLRIVVVFALLLCFTELRSFFVWDQLRFALASIPQGTQIFYLPKLEPLIHLLPERPHHIRMVTVLEASGFLINERRSMLLIPSGVSEVCRAAQWNIELNHGIFSVCDTGQGTIMHLLPLN